MKGLPMKTPASIFLSAALSAAVLASSLAGQVITYPYYGKNRILYEPFAWRSYPTDHFDIYFYEDDPERLKTLAEMCELTGGAPYRAGDADSLTRILAEIDRREATTRPPPTERVKLEWYPAPLGLALLLLTLGQLRELRSGRAA